MRSMTEDGIAILCIWMFLGGVLGRDGDFQHYEVFKYERLGNDDSKCTCTRSSNESRYEWGGWRPCLDHANKFRCHKGYKFRSRACSNSKEEKPCQEREWKYCYHAQSCSGEWQAWSDSLYGGQCSHTCGGGTRIKVRVCTLNGDVGLFCQGRYRSPYDLKKEVCNTHRCPAWSDWKVSFMNCSSSPPYGIIETRRECVGAATGEVKCGAGKNMTEEIIIRKCDYSNDPLNNTRALHKNTVTESEFSPNKLTFILLAAILLLMITLLAVGMCICYKKRGRKLKTLRNQADGIYRIKTNPKYSDVRVDRSLNTSWKKMKYEEVEIRSQHSDSTTYDRRSTRSPPQDSKPYDDSFSSSEETAATYTTMSGSSTSGSRKKDTMKIKIENSDFPRNVVVRLPTNAPSRGRNTSSISSSSGYYSDTTRQRQQQLQTDGYIENVFVKATSTPTRHQTREKRAKRQNYKGKYHTDAEDDFDYAVGPNRGINSRFSDGRFDSIGLPRRESQRSGHLYAEIREFRPRDAPKKVVYAERTPKPIVV